MLHLLYGLHIARCRRSEQYSKQPVSQSAAQPLSRLICTYVYCRSNANALLHFCHICAVSFCGYEIANQSQRINARARNHLDMYVYVRVYVLVCICVSVA